MTYTTANEPTMKLGWCEVTIKPEGCEPLTPKYGLLSRSLDGETYYLNGESWPRDVVHRWVRKLTPREELADVER